MSTAPGAPMSRDAVRAQRDAFRAERDAFKANRRAQKDQAKAMREHARTQVRELRWRQRLEQRRSVVGPLLLVGIGVAALEIERGRWSLSGAALLLGRWWPLLLMAAGGVVLLEWALARLRSGAAPGAAPRLGGGAVVLLLLLTAGGVVVQSTGVVDGARQWNQWFANAGTLSWLGNEERTTAAPVAFDLAPDLSLTLNNPHGDITVTGTSQDGKVHIATTQRVHSFSPAEATRLAAQLVSAQSTNATGTVVSVPDVRGGRADLSVQVPAGTPLIISTADGDTKLSDVRASVSVDAASGDVELTRVQGAARVHMHRGHDDFSVTDGAGSIELTGRADDITVRHFHGATSFVGEFFGETDLEACDGAIHFQTARTGFDAGALPGTLSIENGSDLTADQLAGPVVVTSRKRDITLTRVAGNVTVNNSGGDVKLTLALPIAAVAVHNRGGSVNVTLPPDAGFRADVATTSGDLHSDFALQTGVPGGGGSSLTGSVGTGRGSLAIVNDDDVQLSRGEVQPPPAATQKSQVEPPVGSRAVSPPKKPHTVVMTQDF